MKAKNILAIIATVFSLSVSATSANTSANFAANSNRMAVSASSNRMAESANSNRTAVSTIAATNLAATTSVIQQGVILPVAEHCTFYTLDNSMNVKWECDYDTMGRLVGKRGYVRLTADGEWLPRIAYTLFYNTEETIVTTARWDAAHNTFRAGVVQTHYAAGTCPAMLK